MDSEVGLSPTITPTKVAFGSVSSTTQVRSSRASLRTQFWEPYCARELVQPAA